MSAKSYAIWRSIQDVLRAVGLMPSAAHGAPAAAAGSLFAGVAPLKLTATIEIVEAPEPPDGGTPAALPLPVLAQTAALATMYRSQSVRPLASQMAYTASRNVPKGRKPARPNSRNAHQPLVSTLPSQRVSVIKAKPVLEVVAKKKSPKRRHVWLSTQSRVIRPVAGNNLVDLGLHRAHRAATRPTAQRTNMRLLKLAA